MAETRGRFSWLFNISKNFSGRRGDGSLGSSIFLKIFRNLRYPQIRTENRPLSSSANAGINHTTLTALMKEELGCTAIEYLMKYRITVAKKQLAFTEVPIKDIANMVGFKTVQHFNRIFKEITGTTPAEFRKSAVQKRKEEL